MLQKVNDNYKFLHMKLIGSIDGYELLYDNCTLLCVDSSNDNPVIGLVTFDEKWGGAVIDIIVINPSYRGKNLSIKMYEVLLNKYQRLYSGDAQTPNGQRIWKKWMQNSSHSFYVVLPESDYCEKATVVNGNIEPDLSKSFDLRLLVEK